jgi:hypothetical protein
VRVAAGVAAIDLLDGVDAVLGAQLVPAQALDPIESTKDDRLS